MRKSTFEGLGTTLWVLGAVATVAAVLSI